jgi:predicted enzyme related to lactoylglutathione lyase
MNNKILILLLILLIAGCNMKSSTKNNMTDKTKTTKPEQKQTVKTDTTPGVTGIGGIFFGTTNPKETREWYGKNLGLTLNEYGSTFESRNIDCPDEIDNLIWSPFKAGSDYFAPSKKEFMINYRVRNIEGLVKKLNANGVVIVDKIETYDYGKFVHIMDNDGNKIELWEPVDNVLTQKDSATTKY